MKNQKTVRVLAYLLFAICVSATALAQSAKVDSVAAVAADRSELRWQPQVEYSRLILTVSAPSGEVFRKEFEADAMPSFRLTDAKGVSLPDGHYTYELRVVPKFSREVRKALASSREKGNSAEVIQELQKNGQLPGQIMVQSGSFLIENGAALVGAPDEAAEPPAARPSGPALQSKKKGGGTVVIQDVVTPDDVIIQGSACIGLDCVNNESFGFDTIRLKENNTRIKFEDTSTGAGFPTTDWQLTANDSASGGANKFSIEDITSARVPFTITGGAPTNSLFVSSTGKVGLRTATPVLDLHITTGDTPAHRLEQTNASGFTAQTWDIAGNEANFFVRDVTGGSRLPLRIRPGAPTSSLDIAANGNVGLGTASPVERLHTKVSSGDSVWRMDTANKAAGVVKLFDATGDVTLQTNTTANALYLKDNGNVGIGTTNPLGKLDVNGSIFQRGSQLFADYVFEPTYSLETIEEHASFMWVNKHLPAVGARKVDENGHEIVEIGARMRGMLEEIEKAHIYITTLSDRITQKDAALVKLERTNAELAERLARIEAMLSASKVEKK